jgi:predicted dithiol-disulfide oxidoreductase (DUF899 family)
MRLPDEVSQAEWQAAHDRLLAKEKAATRARDELAAERRELPMLRLPKAYSFTGPDGPLALPDLFEGRRQLIVYHFMLAPGAEHICEGCALFTDMVGEISHLHARDTSFTLVSRAPLPELEAVRRRMGWTLPWVSSDGSDFNDDLGVTIDGHETFGLSVLVRDDEGGVFRTYATNGRGVEALGSVWTFLDLTPLGRQETWERTPAGRPQSEPYAWWRLHDAYEKGTA